MQIRSHKKNLVFKKSKIYYSYLKKKLLDDYLNKTQGK